MWLELPLKNKVKKELSGIFGWTQYCYYHTAELRFGLHWLILSTGMQQGYPLNPLLFSLVLTSLLDVIKISEEITHLWYLDDTVIGPCEPVADFFTKCTTLIYTLTSKNVKCFSPVIMTPQHSSLQRSVPQEMASPY